MSRNPRMQNRLRAGPPGRNARSEPGPPGASLARIAATGPWPVHRSRHGASRSLIRGRAYLRTNSAVPVPGLMIATFTCRALFTMTKLYCMGNGSSGGYSAMLPVQFAFT
jgi:hypothetical protein